MSAAESRRAPNLRFQELLEPELAIATSATRAESRLNDDGIKQLGRNRWAIRVKRVDQRTGKVVNRKLTFEGTKTEAIVRRDELRRALESTQEQRPRTKLREFAAAWLERRRASLKASVHRKYATGLGHIIPALGELYLDAISAADVERYVAGRDAAGAAGNTVLNELRLLRTLARDSIVERYAHRYWCERVKAPTVARYSAERPNLLSPAAAARVLLELPKQWLGLVLLMMTTGLRIGEATALRWIDVDVDAGVAVIRRGNDRGTEVTPKTETSYRAVHVLPAIAALWGARNDGYVFPARNGKLHRGSPLRAPLAKACAAAGVARVTAHGLRRTFNNEGRRHASGDVLRSVTGHASEAMTSHYSLIADSEKAELTRAVAAALGVLDVSRDRTPNGDKPNDGT